MPSIAHRKWKSSNIEKNISRNYHKPETDEILFKV